ncbi:fluoride efflux transporter CrcB [Paenibacillus sp. P96]|uniref:Fluoride-specific ion channel FluC n=1 Tax=Paenibacillus zeirhizosphaerae TaxID=2987519 RepID=A0ABT9FLF9_9BACL|nr:fluoride efflux transporter CrcB [Paenibacillus sp. P96]MDP4095217.1 fluoride efflux transporter CrcB [Paenibacillus sp. P96]
MIWWTGMGGIAGAVLRFGLGKAVSARWGAAFPWGTWVINISGSLLLGALYYLYSQGSLSPALWGMLGVGFCGAYTTFSTFGYETIQLIDSGRNGRAALYVLSSVVLGIAGAALGMELSSWLIN